MRCTKCHNMLVISEEACIICGKPLSVVPTPPIAHAPRSFPFVEPNTIGPQLRFVIDPHFGKRYY